MSFTRTFSLHESARCRYSVMSHTSLSWRVTKIHSRLQSLPPISVLWQSLPSSTVSTKFPDDLLCLAVSLSVGSALYSSEPSTRSLPPHPRRMHSLPLPVSGVSHLYRRPVHSSLLTFSLRHELVWRCLLGICRRGSRLDFDPARQASVLPSRSYSASFSVFRSHT